MKFFNFLKHYPFIAFVIAFALLSLSWFVKTEEERSAQSLLPNHPISTKSVSAKSVGTDSTELVRQALRSKGDSATRAGQAQADATDNELASREMKNELSLSGALELFAQEAELNPGDIQDGRLLEKALANLHQVVAEESKDH